MASQQWLLSNGHTLRLIRMNAGDAINNVSGKELSRIS